MNAETILVIPADDSWQERIRHEWSEVAARHMHHTGGWFAVRQSRRTYEQATFLAAFDASAGTLVLLVSSVV